MRALFSFLIAVIVAVLAPTAHAAPPKGWILAGSEPTSYDVGVDSSTRHGGRASGFLKSKGVTQGGFGTLMQMFGPTAYAGKRVRLSGWIKHESVSDWAGMWMRVDDGTRTPVAFDNMQGRPIKGSRDWTRYEIVLDVDAKATGIGFGVLLNGTGSVWVDDFKFEIVDRSVPTTDILPVRTAPATPQNIDFDE
jgi:hypothetical protein